MSSFRFKNMVVSLLPKEGEVGAQVQCAFNTFRTTTVCVLHTTVTACLYYPSHHCHFGCSFITPVCHYGCTHVTPITCHFGCSYHPTPITCYHGCSFIPTRICDFGTQPGGGCGPASPYEGGLGQVGDPVEELTQLRKGLDELLQNLQKMDQPQTKQDLDNLESNLNEALQEVRQRKENLNEGGNQSSE